MYKKEDQKFVALQNAIDSTEHQTATIERVFVELIEFIDSATDSQILVKIVDVNEFVKRSFDRLEKMAVDSVQMRKQVYISSKLKPFVIDTSDSLALVNKLKMLPPTKETFNIFQMRFLKDNTDTFAEE